MRATIYALALAAVLATSAALAQQSSQTTPDQQIYSLMMEPGVMTGSGMMQMMSMMDPAEHIEGRLAFLKTELGITDAQMPQWNAFADALRANAVRMGDLMRMMTSDRMRSPGMMMGPEMMMGHMMMSGQAGTDMSLLDRLGRAEQHMTAHLEMLRAMKGPTTQLYGVLSDEQKRVADALIHGPMGMMGMM